MFILDELKNSLSLAKINFIEENDKIIINDIEKGENFWVDKNFNYGECSFKIDIDDPFNSIPRFLNVINKFIPLSCNYIAAFVKNDLEITINVCNNGKLFLDDITENKFDYSIISEFNTLKKAKESKTYKEFFWYMRVAHNLCSSYNTDKVVIEHTVSGVDFEENMINFLPSFDLNCIDLTVEDCKVGESKKFFDLCNFKAIHFINCDI